MIGGASESDRGERDDPGKRPPQQSYNPEHGSTDKALPRQRAGSSAGDEDARAPEFPSVQSLAALNKAIHEDAGQPEHYALDQPAPLESCLERARAACSPTEQGVLEAAAVLAHGIAQAQAFRDGNRRTAYWATHAFLEDAGLGRAMAQDDHMVARYLNQVVENQARGNPGPTPETFLALFKRRVSRGRSSGGGGAEE